MIVDETMDEELESLKGLEGLEVPDGYTDKQWALFVGGRARQAYLAESMLIPPQKEAVLIALKLLSEVYEDGSCDFDELREFLDFLKNNFAYTIESFCDEYEDEITEKENIQ